MEDLLAVKDLKVHFKLPKSLLPAVDGVDFSLRPGETIGLVGESGSGKSVTALSVMGLIPCPPGQISGQILFAGQDLLTLEERKRRRLRGKEIAMIFQEPLSALNPLLTIGEQIGEAIRLHQGLAKKEAVERTVDMLELVGIPSPERRRRDYPHLLSGGMRQRVLIAMALACQPKLLFADEACTALDVTLQAQILHLFRELQAKFQLATVFISHDLSVVAEMVERVVVMYAGKFVEEGPVNALFNRPLHPYTEGLLLSIPRLDKPKQRLQSIPGTVPEPGNLPAGCSFQPRCPYAIDICRATEPPMKALPAGRQVRCWLR